MDVLNEIYAAIAAEGFTVGTLQMIDNYAKEIQNGREDFFRFNLSEHAGLCKGGSPLIGASIVACYASASLRASCDAEGREGILANIRKRHTLLIIAVSGVLSSISAFAK